MGKLLEGQSARNSLTLASNLRMSLLPSKSLARGHTVPLDHDEDDGPEERFFAESVLEETSGRGKEGSLDVHRQQASLLQEPALDGWVGGWVGGWMGGWMDGWMISGWRSGV